MRAIVDRGNRGRQQVEGAQVLTLGRKSAKAKMRRAFDGAAIEPVISHLKHQIDWCAAF